MKKIIALLFLLFSLNANAWLWVEPYVGYDVGLSSQVTQNPADEMDYGGFTYGARLGWAWKILLIGVDISGMTGSSNSTLDNYNDDVTKGTFGAFAGVNIDLTVIGFRAWVSYFFSDKLSFARGREMNGNGFGLGAGITLLKFIGINFEYRGMNFDEKIEAGYTTDIDYNPSEFVISLSLPLNLF